ncbi:hypothetical protein RF11_03627 [Thelohanellus kitauei]|uniref:Uncharacterized protein n=1 Tax=Thelohanellus kitauei TaxID=669202 RepID=A0A0C2MIQ8_THEKT|nr:hypothetical protein RF11_03627 [Thelohanellus kitauei]
MTWDNVVVAPKNISITGYSTKPATVKSDILTIQLSYTDEGEKGFIPTKLLLDFHSQIGKIPIQYECELYQEMPPTGFVVSDLPLRVRQEVHGVTQIIDVFVNYIGVGFKK